jgi:hypothetical protein
MAVAARAAATRGAVFLGTASSNVVVAVTSLHLNELCRGTGFAYRVDTAVVQAWIQETVGAVLWSQIEP